MREIYKSLSLRIDDNQVSFRICKLDAFSGAQLLQMVRKYMPAQEAAGKKQKISDLIDPVFQSMDSDELKKLMRSCLNHVEVQLPAGYQQVMQQDEWGYPDLEYDTASCLTLTLECVLWSLDNFFAGVGSNSRPEATEVPQ